MNKFVMDNKKIIYSIVSIISLSFVIISIDYELSTLSVLMILILGIFLTQWYLFVGLIKDRESDTLNFFNVKENGQLLDTWKIVTGSGIMTFYLIVVGFLSDPKFNTNGVIVILFYVMGPVFLMSINKWYTFTLTALWIWFPIEWNLISDSIHIELGLPTPALIGLFAMLWPAIMFGRHVPWFDWNLNKVDFSEANKATMLASIFVIPFGMLLLFLKLNFNEFTGKSIGESLALIFLTFAGIYIVQGIMEETLFRDIIMKHWYFKLNEYKETKLGEFSIIAMGILIFSIPFWGQTLRFLATIIPIFTGIATRVGDLARPLGESEGIAIPAFEGLPLWPFYLAVSILLTTIGLLVYNKFEDPMIAALFASAMLFGFAHFEDWRYVLFSSVAGLAYGFSFYKTKNLAASALVHMGLDAVWSLILTY